MRLAKLIIDQIKGIDHLEIVPGTLTVIRGQNGTGKSSVLDAVLSVFAGGSDPAWLRKGAKKGSVVMEIVDDDGVLVATITKTVQVKRKGDGISTTLEILDPNGVPIPAPQAFVNSLGEAWAVDPSSILNIDASKAEGRKALVSKLLEIVPVAFGCEELAVALGGVSVNGLDVAAGTDLNGLAKARKYIEDMRRKVGAEREEMNGAIQTLRKTLPPQEEEETDWVARQRELEQNRKAIESEEREACAAIEKEANEAGAEAGRVYQAAVDAARKILDETKAAIAQAKEAALAEARDSMRPKFDVITSDLATARQKAEVQTRAAGVRDSLAQFEERAHGKAAAYESMTSAIERLDSLKKSKLDGLPAGLSFDGDQALIDGIPWQHVNTARRYTAAFEICGSKPGLMPFLVADNVEHFDGDNWKEFESAAIASGFQVIAARVDGGPLTVERVA